MFVCFRLALGVGKLSFPNTGVWGGSLLLFGTFVPLSHHRGCPSCTGSVNWAAVLGMGEVSAVRVQCLVCAAVEKLWIALFLVDSFSG